MPAEHGHGLIPESQSRPNNTLLAEGLFMSWKIGVIAAVLTVSLAESSTRAGDRVYGHGAYRYPGRNYPRYGVNVDLGIPFDPFAYTPGYYEAPPVSYPPVSFGPGVTVFSLPEGNVTYTVTRPAAPAEEVIPVPPMPRVEPDPTSVPRSELIAPRAQRKVWLPGEGPPRTNSAKDRAIVNKNQKKN
jgi:hypothetical protein